MHALEHDSSPDWSSLAPLLDDAVNALGEADRRAILLRFYERRDLHTVGDVLGVSDDAAQKRVSRALEKLRVWLGRRGVTSSTAALAGLLGAHSVTAAPAGTALIVTTGALATAGAAAGAGTGTLTLVELMMHLKTKVAVVAAVAVALTGTLVWKEHAIARTRLDNRDRAAALEQLRLEPNVQAAQAQADAKTERAPDERADLERLRTEVATLRAQLEKARAARFATAGAAAKGGGGQGSRRPGFISARDARDVGSATTEALFQTMFWAMARGDTNRVIELADWSAEGAQQQKEVMARQLASFVADAARPGALDVEFRVVRQVPLPDGDTAEIVEMSREHSLERVALRARRAGAEWRLVVDRNGPQEVDLGADLNRD
jgi:hypothetical protein